MLHIGQNAVNAAITNKFTYSVCTLKSTIKNHQIWVINLVWISSKSTACFALHVRIWQHHSQTEINSHTWDEYIHCTIYMNTHTLHIKMYQNEEHYVKSSVDVIYKTEW